MPDEPILPVVIVGAGPAGLAVADALTRSRVRPTILEAGEPGDSWRRHPPWLRLHTNRRDSSLPRRPLPRGDAPYSSRDDVVAYLAGVAGAIEADLRSGAAVAGLVPPPHGAEGWGVLLRGGSTVHARHVVIATGAHRVPVTPAWAEDTAFGGPVRHAAAWRELLTELRRGGPSAAGGDPPPLAAGELAGRRVLVVGLGNTGADAVAAFAAAGAGVAVAIAGPVHLVPRELLGVNWRIWYRLAPGMAWALGRIAGPRLGWGAARLAALFWGAVAGARFGDLRRRGLRSKDPAAILEHWRAGRPPLTSGPFVAAIREGRVELLPAVTGLEPGAARLADGRRHRCDAVLLATGYRHGLEDLLPPALASLPGLGTFDGPLPDAPGLWLCGFRPELLRIRRSARRIARAISDDLAGRRSPRLRTRPGR